MAVYAFRCKVHGAVEAQFPIGTAPLFTTCFSQEGPHVCGLRVERDFETEFATQSVVSDDEFRKAWLSTDIDRNLQEQCRPIDPLAPKDKFEAKHVRSRTGRVYFGNDDSKLGHKARRAIDKGRKGEFAYQEGKKDLR
jgi:hypothetical protein